MKVKNLIVGAGLSGVVLAERIASHLGEEVVVIEQRNHIGGNCYDYVNFNGVHVHKYGPHVFHTNLQKVWDYLSCFTEWHFFMYRVNAIVDGNEVNIPFNLDSLHKVFPKKMAERLEEKLIQQFGYNASVTILDLRKFEDPELRFLADYIYRKIFLGYTQKQWGVSPEEIDSSVLARIPILISRDSRYFQDKYQAIPKNGYTAMIEKILDHPLITVKLETRFQEIRSNIKWERLFYTGSIDEYFNYSEGALPYRSLDLRFVEYDQEEFQSLAQINYPENYDFTRVVEYKKYLNEQSSKTIVSYEYPQAFEDGKNERYYPIPHEENQKRYNEYLKKAKEKNVFFFGRLGDYQYYNMDLAVERALDLFEELKK